MPLGAHSDPGGILYWNRLFGTIAPLGAQPKHLSFLQPFASSWTCPITRHARILNGANNRYSVLIVGRLFVGTENTSQFPFPVFYDEETMKRNFIAAGLAFLFALGGCSTPATTQNMVNNPTSQTAVAKSTCTVKILQNNTEVRYPRQSRGLDLLAPQRGKRLVSPKGDFTCQA
jgi:hypothetical protein